MIGIHPLHRRLAEITLMSTDKQGNIILGWAELYKIIPLLRQNLELVRKLDELRNLALEAQAVGDMTWVQDICARIDELEATLI